MTRTLGTWSQIASAEIIDMIGLAGFAFTIIDVEHGYFGLETAENLIRACDAARIEPWLRVPSLDPVLIGKALDCGARRIVVPGVSSPAQAATAVAAGRYGPEGTRGACPCVRAGGHFIRDWRAHVARACNSSSHRCAPGLRLRIGCWERVAVARLRHRPRA